MAISDTARSAAFKGLEIARGRGVTTSFDVNYRKKLWTRVEDAVNVLSRALNFVDIVFLDEDEASLLLGVSMVDDVFRELRSRFGIDKIVLKLGVKGSMAYWEGRVVKVDAFRVPVKDPIGAGDAYAGGVFLASILRGGHDVESAMRRASAAAAMVVMVRVMRRTCPGRMI